ncbi:uncharacterized protein LOC124941335 [Impatiens glandulifera]|uniref:uncharacterized protein LOC124941335 n=1 Tax=Impatiens glandulifera TaxID=253017 RepID=UPI001FB0E8CF|nr:uncharacterized protein LOC124941335 [Impatiens glandulifera]
MAHHPSDRSSSSRLCIRLMLVLVGLLLVVYILGKQTQGRLKDAAASCPPCDCDCSSENIFSLPLGLVNSSYSDDCGKDDPSMKEEMKKDITSLLSEEILLMKNVTDDNLRRTNALTIDAMMTSSHYQKEAEKCNAGMETCEGAREMAESELTEERKLTALWESRAREFGWTSGRRRSY